MKNIQKNLFLKIIIIVSVFNVKHCLPSEKRIGCIRLRNGEGMQGLSNFLGFSCIVRVNSKLNFIIDIDQTSYPNIKEIVQIHLVDASDKKIYDFNPLVASQNTEGEFIHSTLNLKNQYIKHYELENTLNKAPKETLYLCIIEDKDLYVSINNQIYIFKNISLKEGIYIDKDRFKSSACILLKEDLKTTEELNPSKRENALDEQKYMHEYIKNSESIEKLNIDAKKTRAEAALLQCLENNINNPDLGVAGIPKICQRFAISCHKDKADEMIAQFKQIMYAGPRP